MTVVRRALILACILSLSCLSVVACADEPGIPATDGPADAAGEPLLTAYPLTPEQEAARALAHSLGFGAINYDALDVEKSANADADQLAARLLHEAPDGRAKILSAIYVLGAPLQDETVRDEARRGLGEIRSRSEVDFKRLLGVFPNAFTVGAVQEYLARHVYDVAVWTRYYDAATLEMLKARYKNPATPEAERALVLAHLGGVAPELPPLEDAPTTTDDDGDDTSANAEIAADPMQFYKFMMEIVDKLPTEIRDKDKLINAVKFLQGMLFKDTGDQYPRDPTDANYGIINYFSELNADPKVAMTTALVLSRLAPLPRQPQPLMWDATETNVWPLALEAVHGDRVAALRGLVTFGHDDCCNLLNPRYATDPNHFGQETAFLNNAFFGDIVGRGRILNMPGSLDGLNISDKLMAEYRSLDERSEALGLHPKVRAEAVYPAYYHFYGGAAVAVELITHGYDREGPMRIPVFLSEMLGYFYKMLANEANYIKKKPDLWQLHEAGYRKYMQAERPALPAGWDQNRYDQAILLLDFAYLAVELNSEQHRKGAEWAWTMLSQ